MNIFNKRPLLLALFTFAFFCVLCTVLSPVIKIIGISILLALFCIFAIIFIVLVISQYRHIRVFATSLLCIGFSLVAFLTSFYFFNVKLDHAESLSEEVNVVAEIKERTYYASYTSVYTAKIKSIDGRKTNFYAKISSNDAIYLEEGQIIVSDMFFSPFSVTEYGYDARMTNISEGILTSAVFTNVTVLEDKSSPSIVSLFNKLRTLISDTIDQNDFENTAPIIKALLIGDRTDITAKTKYDFTRLGISHILSISGTHFTVLLGMIAVLLSILGLNKRIVYIILIPTAVFYMGLSGFSFSVCRAGIMALLSYGGFLLGRQRDSFTSLFIALAVILIAAPYAVLSISLWLSFTATFTILVILEFMGNKLFDIGIPWYKKLFNYILTNLLVSVSISFSTLPIISLYFGYISKISPIANLTLVPLFEIFLYIIPFAVIFSGLTFPVAIAESYGSKLLELVEEIASIDNLLISVNYSFVTFTACIGLAVTLILLALPLKRKWIIAIPSVISLLIITIGITLFTVGNYYETNVTYFNTRTSDSIVLTDTNKTMCIDITNGASSAMYYTESVVNDSHFTEIYAYVFTHCRSDHINLLKRLSSRIKIHKVYLPSNAERTSAEYTLYVEEIAKELDISIAYYEYGIPFKFEQCEILVFKPEYLSRTTHEIISFEISTPKDDLLYLGSSFSDGKFDYTNYINDAEYIIFGQHNPIIKNRYYIDTNATLIYGSKAHYDLSDVTSAAYVLNNGGRYHFSLK